jgi:hypothetical protein
VTEPTDQAKVARIEDALDQLLRAIDANDRDRELQPRMPTKVIPADEFPKPPDHELEIRDILRDPVGHALRREIKSLGGHLFRILESTNGLKAVLERVAGREPSNYTRRATILNEQWHGIGAGNDFWVA